MLFPENRAVASYALAENFPVLTPREALSIEDARAELGEALGCVAAHDLTALRRVYDLTSKKLFGICLRICGDRGGAEDVMQDVLIKIWTHSATYDPARSSPITWLCAIARNSSIDWLRVNDRHSSGPSSPHHEVADPSVGAEQELLARQQDDRLHLCLEELEKRQRSCIRAAFFDGMTYADLAKQMNTPLSTIKTWVRRGMQQLRMCLSDG